MTQLLTVTEKSTKKLVSIPLAHVVSLGEDNLQASGFGRVETTRRDIVTLEDYSELVRMWMDLTGTGEE